MKISERAAMYLAFGWHPIYIPHLYKRPVDDDWQKAEKPLAAELPAIFRDPCNIGVILGTKSNNLVDFDLDCIEAVRLAQNYLPKTMTFGRKGKPRSHWLYKIQGVDILKTHQCQGIVELRGGPGSQTVFPGSTWSEKYPEEVDGKKHPQGGQPIPGTEEEVIFHGDADTPTTITWEDAVTRFHMMAAACLIAQHWTKESHNRDNLFLALVGGLLRSKGWDIEKTQRFISLVCTAAADDEKTHRIGKVENTAEKIKNGEHTSGWPTLTGYIGDKVVKAVQKHLGVSVSNPLSIEVTNVAGTKSKDPKFLWAPYIPLGEITMVVGDPGIGKGWFGMALAQAIATGGGIATQKRTAQGRVLLLSAEDSIAVTLKNRSKTFKNYEQAEKFMDAVEESFPLDERGCQWIDDKIEEKGYKLIIIDPLMSYTGDGTNMNQTHEVKRMMTPLLRIAQRHECAIVIVNHMTKDAQKASTLYRALGSIGIAGSARSALFIAQDPTQPDRNVLVHVKANYSKKGDSLLYHIKYISDTEGKFEWLGTSELNEHTMFNSEKKVSKTDTAISWLMAYFEEKNITCEQAAVVIAAAQAAKIGEKALLDSTKTLGIDKRQEMVNGKKVWMWYYDGREF